MTRTSNGFHRGMFPDPAMERHEVPVGACCKLFEPPMRMTPLSIGLAGGERERAWAYYARPGLASKNLLVLDLNLKACGVVILSISTRMLTS